jgi:hypothetical protein
MKRRFRKFRDDLVALTTLQNPTIELRSHAELVQAALIHATQEQAAPAASVASGAPAPWPACRRSLLTARHCCILISSRQLLETAAND